MFPGGRGRPSVEIEEEQLKMMYKLGYSASKMAELFGCSSQLIYKKLNSYGLKQRERYTELTDQELDEKVRALQIKYPNAGCVVCFIYLTKTKFTLIIKVISFSILFL